MTNVRASAICVDCNQGFAPASNNARYCVSCTYPLVECPVCGLQFKVARRQIERCQRVYCSNSCKARGQNALRAGRAIHSLQGQKPPRPEARPAVVSVASPEVPWLTYDEAASLLGVLVGEVYSLVAAGVLQTFTDRSDPHNPRTLLWRDTVDVERRRRLRAA